MASVETDALSLDRGRRSARKPRPVQSPAVSVVIPSYNAVEWVRDAVESALGQSYADLEVVVVDDASKDETFSILERIDDQRVRLYRNRHNIGQSANWNRAVALARGRYLKFLCADDLLRADCVERMAAILDDAPEVGLVFSRREFLVDEPTPATTAWQERYATMHERFGPLETVNSGDRLFRTYMAERFDDNWIGEPSNVMMRRSTWDRIGGFHPHIKQAGDMALWIRAMFHGDVGFIDEPLSTYRISTGSVTANSRGDGSRWLDRLWLFEWILSDPQVAAAHPEIAAYTRRERLRVLGRGLKQLSRPRSYRLRAQDVRNQLAYQTARVLGRPRSWLDELEDPDDNEAIRRVVGAPAENDARTLHDRPVHALFLAYYFPPIGGAGAQRPAKFVRHLSELGYSTTVVTGPGVATGRWTPVDATLGGDLPAGLDVRRAEGEPETDMPWRNRAQRWVGFEAPWPRWWVREAVAKGREVKDADVIYAVMSPYASAEAACRLSRELRKPWIADLGDPWALDEMLLYPTGLHRRRELKRMRHLLRTAAAIVTTTPEAARRIREEFPELATRTIVSIPCGYDRGDFERPALERADGKFRIVHTGYLHTELGKQQRRQAPFRRLVGGSVPGVDILTRSHIYLLRAIDRLLERDPQLESVIEVQLAGVLSNDDRAVAERSRVAKVLGYLHHRDTVELMRSADLLFLPIQNLPPGRRCGTVPGKTYEYLASGRPILGAIPSGDAHDILEQSGSAYLCAPDDVEAMATAIEQELRGSSRVATPDPEFVSKFEYGELARHVGAVIDSVVHDVPEERRQHYSPDHGEIERRRSVLAKDVAAPTAPIALKEPASAARASEQARSSLFIAYYFPPIGGAGAQRSLNLSRYLPEFGYRTKVISGTGFARGRWGPEDETLMTELGGTTDIVRLPGPEPGEPNRWRGRAERWLRLESEWSKWWVDGVVRAGLEHGRDTSLIQATMSPYNSASAAVELSRRLDKPWIAGLRDPWALDEMMIYSTELHRRRELSKMRRELRSASAVVTTTPEAARRIRAAFPELADRPVVSIPNGFDSSDFAEPVQERNDGKFRIVHAGYLHTELGQLQRRVWLLHRLLGGEIEGVDILTRSHVYLLQAIEWLLGRRPALRSVIELHLAGVTSIADREMSERPFVTVHGYVAHGEAIDLMRSADLLFLPMQNTQPGRRSATVPGKTYEYLASQRPILAAVPEGDTRDLLVEAGNALVCIPDDVPAMAAALELQIDRWLRGEPSPTVAPELLERFERRRIAAEMAALFDSLLEGRTVSAPRERSSALSVV